MIRDSYDSSTRTKLQQGSKTKIARNSSRRRTTSSCSLSSVWLQLKLAWQNYPTSSFGADCRAAEYRYVSMSWTIAALCGVSWWSCVGGGGGGVTLARRSMLRRDTARRAVGRRDFLRLGWRPTISSRRRGVVADHAVITENLLSSPDEYISTFFNSAHHVIIGTVFISPRRGIFGKLAILGDKPPGDNSPASENTPGDNPPPDLGPDPKRPTTFGSDPNPNPNPNRPTGRGIIWKMALTRIPDPNRPTTWGPDPNPNWPTGREISENWR